MNGRARFTAALRGEPVDRVPIFDWVNNPAIYAALLGGAPERFDGALAARLSAALGLDACWAPDGGFLGLPQARYRWLDEARYVDEWGVTWQVGAGSWPLAYPVQHAVRTAADWDALTPPDPDETWRSELVADALREAREPDLRRTPDLRGTPDLTGAPLRGEPNLSGRTQSTDDIAVVAGIRGPFSTGWMLMGLEAMSYALADAPALLDDLFRVAADFWTAAGLRLAALGVDAIVIHDDQGSNTGTFFAPATFRRVVLPHLKRQIETLAATGVPVILHSCGNIKAILPDLVATGIAGLNNLQRAAGMDLAAVKQAWGDRLCLIGNVDASGVLVDGTPAEIEAAVRECLAAAAAGGRYVLATDHSFHEGVPVANVRAFVEAGRRWGGGDPWGEL